MASICDLTKKPTIEYPNFWQYKLILDASANAKDIVQKVVGVREHKLEFSKFSSDKKYASHNLAVLVTSDSERLELFEALKKHAKYVL